MTETKDRTGEVIRGLTAICRVGWQHLSPTRRVSVWTFECHRKHRFDSPVHLVSNGSKKCTACRVIDRRDARSTKTTELIGASFGSLTVIAPSGDGKCLMRCVDCDRTGERNQRTLHDKMICFCRKSSTTHGESKTATHRAWLAMKNRCNNKNDINFHNYGGRGIKVCDRWMTYENFRADMGAKPSGYHLDRIDNNKGYSPENCRWVTHSQNARNMRKSIKITWNGETKQLTDWSDHFGWPHNILSLRYHRGWSVEKMMTTPPRYWPSQKR